MKVVEIKVIYESDDIERATKEISDIFMVGSNWIKDRRTNEK